MTTEFLVEFEEQSKGVVANVRVTSDTLTADEILSESKSLFTKAHAFAVEETMRKSFGK